MHSFDRDLHAPVDLTSRSATVSVAFKQNPTRCCSSGSHAAVAPLDQRERTHVQAGRDMPDAGVADQPIASSLGGRTAGHERNRQIRRPDQYHGIDIGN
jgi:hypothetical protein